MKIVIAFAILMSLPGCAGTGALIYCVAVDHDVNRKCQ